DQPDASRGRRRVNARSPALKAHPLANFFPLRERAELEALVTDIKAQGLREPVMVFEDMILDGRNRYRACQSAGIEPTFTTYTGDDPVSYVISINLRRRHLDESQRAMVAAKLEQYEHGGDRKSDQDANLHLDRGGASSLLNVSERTVASAAKVLDRGAPELVQAVEHGDASVSAAAEVATLPEPEQREVLAGGDKAVKAKAKDLREKRAKKSAAQKAREARRRKREAEIKALQEAKRRESEAIDREMGELACKLIELDREIARAVHKALHGNDGGLALERGLWKELGLDHRWTESDTLDEIRSGGLR